MRQHFLKAPSTVLALSSALRNNIVHQRRIMQAVQGQAKVSVKGSVYKLTLSLACRVKGCIREQGLGCAEEAYSELIFFLIPCRLSFRELIPWQRLPCWEAAPPAKNLEHLQDVLSKNSRGLIVRAGGFSSCLSLAEWRSYANLLCFVSGEQQTMRNCETCKYHVFAILCALTWSKYRSNTHNPCGNLTFAVLKCSEGRVCVLPRQLEEMTHQISQWTTETAGSSLGIGSRDDGTLHCPQLSYYSSRTVLGLAFVASKGFRWSRPAALKSRRSRPTFGTLILPPGSRGYSFARNLAKLGVPDQLSR